MGYRGSNLKFTASESQGEPANHCGRENQNPCLPAGRRGAQGAI